MEFSRYIKYFNYGYFLSKYEPKILKNLLNMTGNVPEINEPLEAGKAQYKQEKVLDKLKSLPNVSRKGRGRNIEPEI